MLYLKNIIITITLLMSVTSLFPDGNINNFELSTPIYRDLLNPLFGQHWHAGLYNHFEYNNETDKGEVSFSNMVGAFILTDDVDNDLSGYLTFNNTIECSTLSNDLECLKNLLINEFRRDVLYRGGYSNNVNPYLRENINVTSIELANEIALSGISVEIGYTFNDMIEPIRNWQWWPPGWYEVWSGEIEEINDMRCDAIVEYSYEKHDIMVAMDNNITSAGTSHVNAHNNLHDGSSNPASYELCPRVQAGDRGNNSELESLIDLDPVLEYFSIMSSSVTEYQIEVKISDNASVRSFLAIEVAENNSDTWHIIKDNNNEIWKFLPIELTNYSEDIGQYEIHYVYWDMFLADGNIWTNSLGNSKFRISVIDQGANYCQEIISSLHLSGQVSTIDGNSNITDVDIALHNNDSGETKYISPNSSGVYFYDFFPNDFGNYSLTFSLYGYPDVILEDVLINSTAISLPSVNFSKIDFNCINVSKNSIPNSFSTINEALIYASENNLEEVKIIVGSGIWEEQILIESLFNPRIEIIGSSTGNTIIQGVENEIGISIYNNYGINIIIRYLTIQNWDCGIEISSANNTDNITIDNCQIINNGYYDTDLLPGAGIRTSSPVTITNCTIANNTANWCDYNPQYDFTGLGAGIYADVSSGLVNITGNEIINNSGREGNALYITGNADYSIYNNKMISNNSYLPSNEYSTGAIPGIKILGVNNVDFRRNIIAETEQIVNSEDYVIHISHSNNINFINNTVIDNSGLTGLGAIYNDGEQIMFNNLFVNNYIACDISASSIQEGFNYFWNNSDGGNNSENPQIIPGTDPINPYGLSWSVNTKSVCIDSGHPDLDNDEVLWYLDKDDQDTDGSRLDIGAVQAYTHNMEHRLAIATDIGERTKYHWWCFPILDTVYQDGDLIINTFGSDFYNNMKTFYYNYNNIEQIYLLPDASLDNYQLNSVQGYKLSMLDDSELDINGSWIDEGNQIGLKIGKNLVGYFLKDSMEPVNALAPILNKLSMIKTEKWSAVKENGVWIGLPVYTFNSGMSIELTATEDCSFIWGGDEIIPVDPKSKTTSKFFEYDEEQDYVPVYVELNEIRNEPLEIGIFVNGICKGATVVDSSLVNINAYVLEDTIDMATAEITFELNYGDRINNVLIEEYSVKNSNSGKFEFNQINLSNQKNFYYVKFDENNDNAEDVTYNDVLFDNYPNPFNPTTTISFSLKQDSKVEILIYNVKGQKVRTLTNEEYNSGNHSVIWNGDDKLGRAISSGVYFYKFIINGRTNAIKKCLMVK